MAKKIVETVVKIAKDIPKVLEANKAFESAKNAEKQIDAILSKPKITAADIKKVNQLETKIKNDVADAKSLGASTSKNSPITKLETAVKEKVADVKAKAPQTAKTTTKTAPKAEEAPGPSNLPKSTVKTPTKASTKTPTKATAKAPTKASKSKIAKIEEGTQERPPYGVFPAIGGTAAGKGLGNGATDGGNGFTGDNTVNPEDLPFGGADVGGNVGDGGDTGDGDTGSGDTGGGDSNGGSTGGIGDSGPNFDDGGSTPPPPEETPPPAKEETPVVDTFDSKWLILKAKLLAAGLPETTVDNSKEYFRVVLKEAKFAGENELENVVDQYLYLPTYQPAQGAAIESPFYKDFGKFNEKLTTKKKPGELVGLVLGYKRVIDKYVSSVSARAGFTTDESIAKYMQNDVSVAELDERANAARLRAINADPAYIAALKELKYIGDPSELTSFFLDPSIGTKALEDRRTSGAFATEAIRRSNEATGIKLDTEFAKEQAARLTALGYSEAQITQLAGQGYENIAEQLQPTQKLSAIYERGTEAGPATAAKIQQELQSEQFLGMASQRRKKLAEQEIGAFKGSSGLSQVALRAGSAMGAI